MKNKLLRIAAVLATTGALGVGSAALAAPAQAAPPNDLALRTYTKCVINHDTPKTDHVLWVTNVGRSTVHNVRVGSVGGPETGIPKMRAGQEFQRGAWHYYSATGVRNAGHLAPRESVKTWTLAPRCNLSWPAVIYTVGNGNFNVQARG
ncbi:hypothetical protein [Gordonia caeni]|uniref:Secreted protein n=1 Tax=Gordonia caeni TaxID=1007097 RepID=A0ABP7P5B3_9ACTN